VLLDSEGVWDSVREQLAKERGGRWHEHAKRDMLGMSSVEWSRYMRDVIGVPLEPDAISELVVERVMDRYREHLPLLPGAVEAVRAVAERWPLGLATSSNRPVIDLMLELTGLAPCFQVTVASEEVGRGKPAPDVYLEAARRLDVAPTACGAIEDSTNGIRSAKAAGMFVAVIPRPDLPPAADALELADVALESLDELPAALSDLR
jgi:HAD superfamily hydrolase (TIGR01509 family)